MVPYRSEPRAGARLGVTAGGAGGAYSGRQSFRLYRTPSTPVKRWRFYGMQTFFSDWFLQAGIPDAGTLDQTGFGSIISPFLIGRYKPADVSADKAQLNNPGIARQSDRVRILALNVHFSFRNNFDQPVYLRTMFVVNDAANELYTPSTDANPVAPNPPHHGGPGHSGPSAYGVYDGGNTGVYFRGFTGSSLFRDWVARTDLTPTIDIATQATAEFNADSSRQGRHGVLHDSLIVTPEYGASTTRDNTFSGVQHLSIPVNRTVQYEMAQTTNYPFDYQIRDGDFWFVCMPLLNVNPNPGIASGTAFRVGTRIEVVYLDQ